MSDKPSTAREALFVELLGDLQKLLDRVDEQRHEIDRAASTTRDSAAALVAANAQYRSQVDELIARLRSEFAAILTEASTQAITKQTAALKETAVIAIRQAVAGEHARRTRHDWWRAVFVSAVVAAITSGILSLAMARL